MKSQPMAGEDAAERLRRRLQADLRTAMKRRDHFDVAVLRVLIAAIDNAGALPLTDAMRGETEMQRRRLGPGDVQALLSREIAARQKVAVEYAMLRKDAESERVQREVALVRRYLLPEPGQTADD